MGPAPGTGRTKDEESPEFRRRNVRRGGAARSSGRDAALRWIDRDRAFAGTRDGVAGTRPVVHERVGRVRGARTLVLEMEPEHDQEIAGGTYRGGLLQRPVEGF